MDWFILIIAGLFEAAFAFCLAKTKETTGNTMYAWYTGFVVALIISMSLLTKAIETLPIGTAYAVWTGIGAGVTAIIGMWLFNDPVTFWRVFFIVTLIGSVAGLKAVGS